MVLGCGRVGTGVRAWKKEGMCGKASLHACIQLPIHVYMCVCVCVCVCVQIDEERAANLQHAPARREEQILKNQLFGCSTEYSGAMTLRIDF